MCDRSEATGRAGGQPPGKKRCGVVARELAGSALTGSSLAPYKLPNRRASDEEPG